jgi:hypothetical protein
MPRPAFVGYLRHDVRNQERAVDAVFGEYGLGGRSYAVPQTRNLLIAIGPQIVECDEAHHKSSP